MFSLKTLRNILPPFTVLLLLSLLYSCAGSAKRDSSSARNLTVSSEKLRVARQSIDDYRTWEIYFTLQGEVPCITLQVSAEYLPYQFATQKKIARTFFILERLVDTSRFEKKTGDLFTELGKNFSDRWGRKRAITICSAKNHPLQRLDSLSLYRLRITTFLPGKFDFTVKIFSGSAVRFFLDRKGALAPEILKKTR